MTPPNEIEEWRLIARYPLHDVSSFGRIRRRDTGRILKASISYGMTSANKRKGRPPIYHRHGYDMLHLRRPNGPRVTRGGRTVLTDRVRVHCIVCETFHGPRPSPQHQAHHLDENQRNNRADNLQWLTPAEHNALHAARRKAHKDTAPLFYRLPTDRRPAA
jgi:hypothetical protein